MILLDTDVASYVIKRRTPQLVARFEQHASALCVSAITAAELRFGAAKRGEAGLQRLVEAFLSRLEVLDWADAETFHYAALRLALEKSGTPLAAMDLLIASHAVSRGAVLVTNNRKHFDRVPGLRIETWPELVWPAT